MQRPSLPAMPYFEAQTAVAYGSINAMNRRFGSYAEFICLPAENWNLVTKPANLTHMQAASLNYGAFLALHMTEKAQIQAGQSLLIYGASGSIGTMAVQLAKKDGAEITAVCSGRNFELVKSLGAHKTIGYTKEDALSQLEDSYDFVIDAVGNSKTSVLKTQSKKVAQTYISIDDDVPSTTPERFAEIHKWGGEGKLKPVIDKCFPLEQMAEAHAYVDEGHKRGNVAISVTDEADHT